MAERMESKRWLWGTSARSANPYSQRSTHEHVIASQSKIQAGITDGKASKPSFNKFMLEAASHGSVLQHAQYSHEFVHSLLCWTPSTSVGSCRSVT